MLLVHPRGCGARPDTGGRRAPALVVNAPEGLRHRLRHLGTDELLDALCPAARRHRQRRSSSGPRSRPCARRPDGPSPARPRPPTWSRRSRLIVERVAPSLLAEPGVGVISAARILNAWSHAGRIRSEAAFAMLAGVAPIPASSGQTVRHRLNRSGDRQLNRALHTIVLSRLQHMPRPAPTRSADGPRARRDREIKRCLKRFVARRLFRLLEDSAAGGLTDIEASSCWVWERLRWSVAVASATCRRPRSSRRSMADSPTTPSVASSSVCCAMTWCSSTTWAVRHEAPYHRVGSVAHPRPPRRPGEAGGSPTPEVRSPDGSSPDQVVTVRRGRAVHASKAERCRETEPVLDAPRLVTRPEPRGYGRSWCSVLHSRWRPSRSSAIPSDGRGWPARRGAGQRCHRGIAGHPSCRPVIGERGKRLGGARRVRVIGPGAGAPSAVTVGAWRSHRSTPRPGKPAAWGRVAADTRHVTMGGGRR